MTGQIDAIEWAERAARPSTPIPTLEDQLATLFRSFRGVPDHLVELVDHLEEAYPAEGPVTPR